MLKISEGTSKSQLFKARKMLQQKLNELNNIEATQTEFDEVDRPVPRARLLFDERKIMPDKIPLSPERQLNAVSLSRN